MWRTILTALTCVAAVVVLAGCGSQGTVKAAPETVVGTLPKPTQEPATPAFKLKGDPTAGKGDFRKLTEKEVDIVMWQAAQAGAKIVKPAGKTFWGGYAGYFADPDGHLWEVAFNPSLLPAD